MRIIIEEEYEGELADKQLELIKSFTKRVDAAAGKSENKLKEDWQNTATKEGYIAMNIVAKKRIQRMIKDVTRVLRGERND